MRVTEIEFGFTKNIGNYESERIIYRASLESWENPEESLEILRDKVAEELNLRHQLKQLRHRCEGRGQELEIIEEKLKIKKAELVRAEMAWENFAEFLTAHGVDPVTLTIENFQNIRIEHSLCIANDCQPESEADKSQSAFYYDDDLDDKVNNDAYYGEEDEDDDAYYGED